MNSRDVAIATLTWVRSEDEERLLRRSLELLAAIGVPVAVADAGTSASFTAFLQALPHFSVTVPTERGLVAQVQAAVALAARAGTPSILYTEPDKEQFFRDHLARFVDRAAGVRESTLALAARSDASFNTYPPMQRYTEQVSNKLCAELIGVGGDYFYGPFVMPRALVSVVAQATSDLGWGWRPFVFQTAHRRGLQLVHLTDEYPCPCGQRGEDDAERSHRLRQLSQNILGLVA